MMSSNNKHTRKRYKRNKKARDRLRKCYDEKRKSIMQEYKEKHGDDKSYLTCSKKDYFINENEAISAIINHKRCIPLRAYRCNVCGYWHITSRKG